MNKNNNLYAAALFILFSSCNNNQTKTNPEKDPLPAEVSVDKKDTAAARGTTEWPDSLTPDNNNQPPSKGSELKKEDPVLQNVAHQSPAVKRYLDGLRINWKNTANPIIATYEGNDFGDYHHIIFKDAKGNTYDFGQAANIYGKYQLHELSGQYEDNPAWLGKRFKVYWEWKLSDFLCCEGEYEKTKAYLPAITKLELIKK
jgi:hypothetical protein